MQDFDRIRSFIQSFSKDEDGLLGDIYRDAVERGVPVIRTDTKELLRLLLLMQKPKRILEIGTAVGFSALLMAECLPDAEIVTLEMDPERVSEARVNIRSAGAEDRITVMEGDAAEILRFMPSGQRVHDGMVIETGEKNEKILRGLEKETQDMEKENKGICFDLVFIDAAKAQYGEYLTLVLPMLSPGALIVSDNVLQDGSILESHFLVEKRDRTIHDRMRGYLQRLTGTEGLTTSILAVGDGVAVTLYQPLEKRGVNE